MKKSIVLAGGVFAVALGVSAGAVAAGSAIVMPAADIKWTDLPEAKGIKGANVVGDPAKGAAQFFTKFAPGTAIPLHHHSADHIVVVVSGTMVETVDGKDLKLPAGSAFAFNGMKPHGTKCEGPAECVVFVDARGKWDVVPEAAPKSDTKADAKKAETKK